MAETKKTNSKTKKKTASKTSPKEGKELKAKKSAAEGAEAATETKAPKAKKAGKPAKPRAPLHARTYFAKPLEHSERWQVIDAAGQPLGRLSTHIAMALMGKDKPTYTRHIDSGAHVVVINAAKVALTGINGATRCTTTTRVIPAGSRASALVTCWRSTPSG